MDTATPLVVSQTSPSSIVEIRSSQHLSVLYDTIEINGLKHSGMIQNVIGTLSVIFGVTCLAIDCEQSNIAYPIWGGVWLVAYATLNIFCAVIAFNMLLMTSEAAMAERKNYKASTPETARVALDCVLVFLGSAEVCAAIWGDIAAFRAICKLNKIRSSNLSQQATTSYQTMGNTGVITSPYPPYSLPGYQPPPGYDPPPKYEDLSTSQTSPGCHDNTTTGQQPHLPSYSS